ncbi:MAG TPA: hypothetical protein VLC12_04050 [Terriglobales bacterium]|nr:hypothetical protein [Terriglobales bacterium]
MRVGRRFHSGRRGQQGYVLLAVILMVAMIVIAAAAAAPDIAMSIRREREAELIHRGTQYMRAIQHYYKKFGRYPARVEDLENTNNIRFLRRRYKDPVTGKDFRLLHFGEVNLGAITGMGAGAGLMGGAAAAAMSGAFGQNPAAGSGTLGQPGGGAAPGGILSSEPQAGMTGQPGMDTTGGQPTGTQGGDALAGKVFGGGPIIGVASTSHAASIREFNKKNHYNDWYFIYDPGLDRGGLVRGPAQPPLAGTGGSVVGKPGTAASSPGSNNSPNMPGFGNPSFPGAAIPAQPQDQPVQQ